MAESMESIVQEHLELYHGVIVNGTMGTDQLYPGSLKARCFSPTYSYLAFDECRNAVTKIDALHEMAKRGRKEEDNGSLADLFILIYRARFFYQKSLHSLTSDLSNPDRSIRDEKFFDEIRNSQKEQIEVISTYFHNLRLIMELMFGMNWKEEKKKVLNLFDLYVHYWEKHESFEQMEKVGVPK